MKEFEFRSNAGNFYAVEEHCNPKKHVYICSATETGSRGTVASIEIGTRKIAGVIIYGKDLLEALSQERKDDFDTLVTKLIHAGEI